MKKLLFLTILAGMATALVFAENFTVVSVTGRVEQESGNQRIEVAAEDVLDGNVVIYTGVGASVVLRDESGKTATVSAGRNGSVAELTAANTSNVRIGGTVSRTDTSAAGRTTARVGTASARASTSVIQAAPAGCNCGVCGEVCDAGCEGSCKND